MGDGAKPLPGNNRQVPRNVEISLAPPVVTVILDHAINDKETFTLASSDGYSVTLPASKATALDSTHSLLSFNIRQNKSRGITYSLVQSRNGSGAASAPTSLRSAA